MSGGSAQGVRIGSRTIGPGNPVYLIAEAGVNHNGSVDAALRMVDVARAAGADAVKFQAFTATRLASRHAPQAAYQKESAGAPSQVEMLERLELQPVEFARIRRHCEDIGIEFLATPFSPEDLRILRDLGIRAIKIASPDIINLPLLQAAAESRLPILLSTGASNLAEIDQAHGFLSRERGSPLVLLHCVSSYPTRLDQANLPRIAALHERYGCPVGFSDHTSETETAQSAVAAGAHVLEKHFTLDRSQPGPDHAFSLSPAELGEYVKSARRATNSPRATPAFRVACREPERGACDAEGGSMAGLAGGLSPAEGVFGLAPIELEVRRVSRCSVTAACDIPAGMVITLAMLVAKRPGTGISPWQIEAVAGRTARSAIPADTPIAWEMLC